MSRYDRERVSGILDDFMNVVDDELCEVEIDDTYIPREYVDRFCDLIRELRVLHKDIWKWNEGRQ